MDGKGREMKQMNEKCRRKNVIKRGRGRGRKRKGKRRGEEGEKKRSKRGGRGIEGKSI